MSSSLSGEGSFVQYKVCSYESKSDNLGSHSYIWVTNDDNHKNFVIESSFTQNTGRMSVLYHSSGSILFLSINISDSNIDANATFSSSDPFSISTTNFSNFDNISSNQQCCFYHQSKTQIYDFCNVIDNKVSDNHAIFYLNSVTLSVNKSFFKGNKASNLFYIDSASPTVNECHFEDNTFETNKNYIHSSKSMTEIFLPNLYSSFLCENREYIKIKLILNTHIPNISISNLFSGQPSLHPSKHKH